ncbi:MAG: hypothetical protein WD011_02215 [Nitriliruptoraceae bacterium]
MERRLYALLIDPDEDYTTSDLDPEVEREVPGNALRQVAAMALQKIGDLLVDAKTVLAWLVTSLGGSSLIIGLLVPIREAGSMLPQAALAPFVRRRAVRKWLWVGGALAQAFAVAAMAVAAVALPGPTASWVILLALTAFALARSLSSLSSKDVLGRTVPKGGRGRVSGAATTISGVIAITVGVAIRLTGSSDTAVSTLAMLLGTASLAWVAAAGVYASVAERPGEISDGDQPGGTGMRLLRDDAIFRRFVIARALLLVSALSPPFVVALAGESGDRGLAGLGPFVIGSGLAALLGGRVWGGFADRSSRRTMILACALSSAVVGVFLALRRIDALRASDLLYPLTYFALALVHTGSRLGRKTYVIDMAEGDDRTDRVAVSNAAMGVLLLGAGAVSASVATLGADAALLLLATLGVVGIGVSRALPEVTTAD